MSSRFVVERCASVDPVIDDGGAESVMSGVSLEDGADEERASEIDRLLCAGRERAYGAGEAEPPHMLSSGKIVGTATAAASSTTTTTAITTTTTTAPPPTSTTATSVAATRTATEAAAGATPPALTAAASAVQRLENRKSGEMTQCTNNNNNSLGGAGLGGGTPASDSHSQLDMRKVPQEEDRHPPPPPRYQRQHHHHQQQQQQQQQTSAASSWNEQRPAAATPTITPAPTSLEGGAPATMASATATIEHADIPAGVHVAGEQGGSGGSGSTVRLGGGGGGGGAAADGKAGDGEFVYKGPKVWRYMVLHWRTFSVPVAVLTIFLALWTIGFILLPDYAAPQTAIMRIFLLFVGAQICGMLMTLIHLPDMLGMLFFGVLYANVGWADFTGYQPFEAFLREMALINIMLLAGFGLDAKAFRSLWFMILRLTLIPTVAEVTVIMLLAHWLLAMPWLWGITLGLVVTAISPNVVVTVMLKMKEERLGLNGGIHTLIYAMTTCNDVVAIFLFGVILGIIFATGNLTEQILQGPIGIGIGIVYGYLYGLLLQYLPSRKSDFADGLRFILTVLGGTISVMGSRTIGYPSAGALGCVMIAFIAGLGWRQQQREQRELAASAEEAERGAAERNTHANENLSVVVRLDLLWKFLKPVSFALIGKEINFGILDGTVVGYGALLVLVGSLFRLAFAYVSTYGGQLTWRERAYITISGIPKATVQAALGPIALDMARSLNAADSPNIALAHQVLIISVLAIILTAPLGAVLMLRLAPHWLRRCPDGLDLNGCNNDAVVLDLRANEAKAGGGGGGVARPQ